MTKSLLTRSVPATGASPQFQPSQASSFFARELGQSLNNVSNDLKAKSDLIYINSFLSEANKGMAEINFKNQGSSPEQLRNELDSYKNGLLEDAPRDLQQKLLAQYDSVAQSYINRSTLAFSREQKRLLDEKNKEYESQIKSNMALGIEDNIKADFIKNEDERVLIKDGAINNLITQAEALEVYLSTLPEDKAFIVQKEVRQSLLSSGARTWFDSQPNKIEALARFKNNEAIIEMPNEKGEIKKFNLRRNMDEQLRRKMEDEFSSMLKNDIATDRRLEELEEKELQEEADELEKEFFTLSTTGQLTPAMVEASRNILDPKTFNNFQRMAIEANPVTNGVVYGNLLLKLEKGQDIGDDLEIARFTSKSISNEDFESLLNANKQQSQDGVLPSPVEAGRADVLKKLQEGSEFFGSLNNRVLAAARRDYDDRVQEFIDEFGRTPRRKEALEIADEVEESYATSMSSENILALPKPRFMDSSVREKGSEQTLENLEKVKKDTVKFFKNKHKGDIEKALEDPEYIRESLLLNKYESIFKKKSNK